MVVGHLENEKVFEDDVIHGISGLLLANEGKIGNAKENVRVEGKICQSVNWLCV
jgi:hypothetical protein